MVNKISKFYNRITGRALINNSRRFRVAWRSQCNGGQKRERRERPVLVELFPICRKIWLQEKRSFIRITHSMPFKT